MGTYQFFEKTMNNQTEEQITRLNDSTTVENDIEDVRNRVDEALEPVAATVLNYDLIRPFVINRIVEKLQNIL